MSKKKNTLNDLEEFLKMQASALVTPAALPETVRSQPEPVKSAPEPKQVERPETRPTTLSEQELMQGLQQLSVKDKKAFYDLLIRAAENLPNRSKEDLLLINTALYLKGGTNWKEVVKDYWKNSR
jgi:hypothetical protein